MQAKLAQEFDLQQRWFGNEDIDKDDNLHGHVFAQVIFGAFLSFVWTF